MLNKFILKINFDDLPQLLKVNDSIVLTFSGMMNSHSNEVQLSNADSPITRTPFGIPFNFINLLQLQNAKELLLVILSERVSVPVSPSQFANAQEQISMTTIIINQSL